MRKVFVAASILSFAFMNLSAEAMPLGSAPAGAPEASIIQVAQGCGPGMHRGPAGACRPMFSCPRGWHPGPYGRRCFRNW